MTTASVLVTVSTWNAANDKVDKEAPVDRVARHVAAIASRELRETPSTREQALRIMREWIAQNRDIRHVRQDDNFLLRFLRQKKFSVPMAQQTLLKYLSLRKYYSDSFSNLDCENQKMNDIVSNGYIAVSPIRDSKGRRVILYHINKFDTSKYTCWDMCRVHAMVYETLLEDPADQVCGVVHVGDGNGVTGAHVTAWNPADFARLLKWGEQSIPMRHKEFHLMNVPAAVKYVVDFALSKVTPKMSERLKTYTNVHQLHKNVDVACLPTIHGGSIPLQEMIEFTKQLLTDHRKRLLSLDDMEILSTKGIISSRNTSHAVRENTVSVEGSFRKLEID